MSVMQEDLWEIAKAKATIPPLIRTPSPMQLFMFSAVTWNRHLIHYNSEYAASDGFKHVAVHRALIGSFLSQMLSNWVGDRGMVSKVDWSVRGSAPPGEPITCEGRVIDTRVEGETRYIECEIWAKNSKNEIFAPGTGTVVLFK
jgi:hydroxyacyl-ACP dehydratase HTD2-like protein with hotdog domain